MAAEVFLRVATKQVEATTYRYLQLCESVRVGGRPTNRVLYSFGNLNRLPQATLVALSDRCAALAGESRPRASTLTTEGVWEYGAAAVAQHLWQAFGLTERLRRLWGQTRRSFDPVPYLQLVVANRLMAPRSKLGVWQWAERVALPAAAQASSLHHYYRALDALFAVKEPLEVELWHTTRDLFNLEVDLVFYDLTSTYFEGDGPEGAAYGYSRDKRPDRRQVVLALACDRKGFPIAHEVLPGKRADVTTLLEMVGTLGRRFAIRRCVLVADSGMVSGPNLAALEAAGYGYVVAVKRQRLAGMAALVAAPLEAYQAVGHGLRLRVGEADEGGRRLVCCYSTPRAQEQRQIREARLGRAETALAKLQQTVARGALKDRDKIVARAAQQVAAAQATRYLTYGVEEGRLSFARRPEVLAAAEALDGKYFLLAQGTDLSPAALVDAYYTLQEVERAFREMKDFLKLRPIYHWTDRRVRAHIFACVLAYLLEKALGEQLRRAGLSLSARQALDQLSTLHQVETRLGNSTVRTLSRPSPQVQAILKAVGLSPPPTEVHVADQGPAPPA